jgi:hypothetical protein
MFNASNTKWRHLYNLRPARANVTGHSFKRAGTHREMLFQSVFHCPLPPPTPHATIKGREANQDTRGAIPSFVGKEMGKERTRHGRALLSTVSVQFIRKTKSGGRSLSSSFGRVSFLGPSINHGALALIVHALTHQADGSQPSPHPPSLSP